MTPPRFGLITHPEDAAGFNLGDYIQSIAVREFLPRVDQLIPRDALSDYRGPRLALVCNGWFGPTQADWTPSKDINPLFISFHLSPRYADAALSAKSQAYLKAHEPIGCRDEATVLLLREHGIEAYFSGCLTLTLRPSRGICRSRQGIFLVDPFLNDPLRKAPGDAFRGLLRAATSGRLRASLRASAGVHRGLPSKVWDEAHSLSHQFPRRSLTEEQKFDIAAARLDIYAKAKLVITSRLHCALPCLAFGTPVIFINGYSLEGDTSRLSGLTNLLDRLDLHPDGTWTPSASLQTQISDPTMLRPRTDHEPLSNSLRARIHTFINERL